jgi:biotin carboxylase
LDHYLPCRTDYGFGVVANDRLLVERYIGGQLLGCDCFSCDGRHVMLGINEKLMFSAPSCAIQGSCFPAEGYDRELIERYVFSILDALGFNDGVTHTELILAGGVPMLVEVNPRLVGAKIPRLLNLALGRSLHADLINLHLYGCLPDVGAPPQGVAVSRWVVSYQSGRLQHLRLPQTVDTVVQCTEMLKKTGDSVAYPYQNADRIGYVLTLAATREQAEQAAEQYVAAVEIGLEQP